MNVHHVESGPLAVEQWGVHECERATMLNQTWLFVGPEFRAPCADGSIERTLYIVCGLCHGFRHD